MNKLLVTLIAVALSQSVLAADDLAINLGGTTDRTTTGVNTNVSYSHKDPMNSSFSEYVDFDSIYKSINKKTTTNLEDVYGKVNYNLDDRNYLQTAARFQHNEFGKYQNMEVIGVGHGFRLINNDTTKVSLETSIAKAEANNLNQTIFRESVWGSYRFTSNSSVSDKLLIEEGGSIHYVKNILALQHNLTKNVFGSVTHTWIKDQVNNSLTNVTAFNLGMNF
jgi:putative salt-induced outer membrane protein YdiY